MSFALRFSRGQIRHRMIHAKDRFERLATSTGIDLDLIRYAWDEQFSYGMTLTEYCRLIYSGQLDLIKWRGEE